MSLRKCWQCKGLVNFDPLYSIKNPNDIYVGLEKCQNCSYISYVEITRTNALVDCYPKPDGQIDDELPNDVKIVFKQAIESLSNGSWDACVVMSRRAIEEAVKILDAEGKDLFHKIDDLEEKRKITPTLKEWAHETRLAGKLGAHGVGDKKFADREDAEEITEFCRWFLRYLFVLPKQLIERRSKITGEDKSKEGTSNHMPLLPS